MKKLFLLISIFILCLTACSSTQTDELKEFPENLILECEIPSDYPETLNVYDVIEFFDFNEDKMLDMFFADTEYECLGEDAFGNRFESIVTVENTQEVVVVSFNPIYFSSLVYTNLAYYNDPNYFDNMGGLISIEDAEKCVVEVVSACINSGDETIELVESKFDEENNEYIFTFEELLDGIPICNEDDVYYLISKPKGNVIYDGNGIRDFWFGALWDINETVDEFTLTSVNDVLNVIIDMYNNNLNLYDSYIEEIELNYVLQLKEAGNYDNLIAVPAWVITLRHETDEYTDYEFIVINAETAEIINTREEIPWGDS